MKGPVKAIILAVAMFVLIGAAFWGGMWYQNSKAPTGPGGLMMNSTDSGGRTFQGGPMAGLTEEEQAELESMSEGERQQWLQDQMPAGAGQGGPVRGGNLEGEVVEVADDSITVKLDSGSQTFYTDEDTVVAYAEGAGALAPGSAVMVFAGSSSDGVATATLLVVK
ncbi:MAG: DUF5666 domain-containing protein [Coriobacteriia bacterium]|nr:DUF5666 domain-containing protein [Coriobacteriia bacterium]